MCPDKPHQTACPLDTSQTNSQLPDVMAQALSQVQVNKPAVPVVSNVKASALSDPADIVKALVAQVTGTVRWRESVSYIAAQDVKTFYEVGAGKVLSGLIKRIADGAATSAIGAPDDIATFKAGRNT
jgi:[acyl-carrier-protein] S-malonyltransferase